MATNIGTAIALGNIAQPVKSLGFTNAVMNRQRLDLAGQAQEAKRRAEIDRNAQEIAKSLEFKTGGTLPIYQNAVSKVYSTGVSEFMAEKDPIRRASIKAKTQQALDNIKYNNDQLASGLAYARSKGLADDEIMDIVNSPESEANAKYAEMIKRSPQKAVVLGKTPQGSWSINAFDPVDLKAVYEGAINKLKASAEDTGQVESIGGGQNQFRLRADPKAVAAEAEAIALTPNVLQTVMYKDPIGYSKWFDKTLESAKTSAQKTGSEPTKEDVQYHALLGYLNEKLTEGATYTERKGQPTPSNMQLSFGGFGGVQQPSEPFGGATGNRLPVIINPTTKQTADVVLGNSHSFKPTKIIGIKPSGVLDANTNELLSGISFEQFDVGDVKPTPIAIEDISFTSRGGGKVTIKKGTAVPEGILARVKEEGKVEYQPMFVGTVTFKDKKGKTTERSVLVPASLTADGVVASQSKDDAPMTVNQIQSAVKEAEELTTKLNARFKPKATKPTSKTTKSKTDPLGLF